MLEERKKKCFLSNVLEMGLIERSFFSKFHLSGRPPRSSSSLINDPTAQAVIKMKRGEQDVKL